MVRWQIFFLFFNIFYFFLWEENSTWEIGIIHCVYKLGGTLSRFLNIFIHNLTLIEVISYYIVKMVILVCDIGVDFIAWQEYERSNKIVINLSFYWAVLDKSLLSIKFRKKFSGVKTKEAITSIDITDQLRAFSCEQFQSR